MNNILESINIEVIRKQDEASYSPQLIAILNELRNLLLAFRQDDTTGSIDLRSLPMFPGDYQHLKEVLGEGEVKATLTTLGTSEIRETSIPGIWWITHKNIDDDTIAEFIEVTSLPDLIKTPQEELVNAVDRLEQLITHLAVPDHI